MYYAQVVAFQFKKHFKLDEARALLPQLRQEFQTIHTARDRLIESEKALEKRFQKSGGDCGGPLVHDLLYAMIDIHENLSSIASQGIQIKDVDRGLVDFPYLRQGREVLLCWELEEDDIEFWHEIDVGFPGRERL